jgi:glycosyltransferase involved in cell wall biosynthesis
MYKYYEFNSGYIVYSIVVPIYNQEKIIVKNLQSIIDNTVENFEIILILDYCFDNTEKNIFDYLNNYTNIKKNLICIKIFKNEEKPLFETKCDNIGFKNSLGKYCLEIQADMEMTENGYNLHLTKPFNLYNNVIAVSGRCAHNLFQHDGIGKLGTNIEKNVNELNIDKNKFYVLETCNRGPLLIERKKLEELNFLDEENYFLDDSDHDLMARAYLEKKYICGYVPIDFKAPLCDGSTRNNINYDCDEYNINMNEKRRLINIFNQNLGLNKYKNVWKNKKTEIYDI